MQILIFKLVAARLIEVIIEIGKTIVEFLLRTGLTRAEADVIVTKIQTGFRNHLAAKKRLKLGMILHIITNNLHVTFISGGNN